MTPAAREHVDLDETRQTFTCLHGGQANRQMSVARRDLVSTGPLIPGLIVGIIVRGGSPSAKGPGRPIFMSKCQPQYKHCASPPPLSRSMQAGPARSRDTGIAGSTGITHQITAARHLPAWLLVLIGRNNLLKTSNTRASYSGLEDSRESIWPKGAGQAEPNRTGSPETNPQGCACALVDTRESLETQPCMKCKSAEYRIFRRRPPSARSLGRPGDLSRSYALLNGLVRVEREAARNSRRAVVRVVQDLTWPVLHAGNKRTATARSTQLRYFGRLLGIGVRI